MASNKRRCFEKVRERRERVEVKDNLLYHGNRWVIHHDPALKLRIQSQNHDSKVARHLVSSRRPSMPEIAIKDSW
jgi:hypothetical protein